MNEQYELFSGVPPHQKDSETSLAAAEAVLPRALGNRARVLAFIQQAGARGATDREIQAALGLRTSSEVPRRRELVIQGRVMDGGRRRSIKGHKSVVWVIRSGEYKSPGLNGKRPNWKGYFLDLNQRVARAMEQLQVDWNAGKVSTQVKKRIEETLRPLDGLQGKPQKR